MACSSYTLRGIVNECETSIGGVVEVYVAHKDKVKAATGVTSENGYDDIVVITGITMDTGETFIKYYVRKNTSSMTSTFNLGDNGASYYSTELVLDFARMTALKRMELVAMALDELVVIVKDANGKYYFLGYDNPVSASAETGETGTQRSDANHYTVTLADESNELPHFILDSVIESVLG